MTATAREARRGRARRAGRRAGQPAPRRGRFAGGAARRAGFTLLELVVALAITGLVALAAVDAARTAADAWTRVNRTRSRTLGAANARILLGDWIRAATAMADSPAVVGTSRSLGGLPRDELVLRVRDAGGLHPGPHRVHLWIGRLPGAARSGLLAALTPIDDAPAEEEHRRRSPARGRGREPDTLVVAPGAGGMALRFLVREGGRDRWLHAWEEEEAPRAVEIRLVPAPYDVLADSVPLAPLLRAPIVAPIARWSGP
ncbi:MAG TPA: prepilin-type N-terminal cleavage/methylation domain-containing protein [Longimicrobiales bacterium]